MDFHCRHSQVRVQPQTQEYLVMEKNVSNKKKRGCMGNKRQHARSRSLSVLTVNGVNYSEADICRIDFKKL